MMVSPDRMPPPPLCKGLICKVPADAGRLISQQHAQQFTIIRIGVETISGRGLKEGLGTAYDSILQYICALSDCKFIFIAQLDTREPVSYPLYAAYRTAR